MKSADNLPPPIPGFRFAGIEAGIKKRGGPDLALAVADAPATVAGLYTNNLVRAAPVEIARSRAASGSARAVLVNSGCANACTGAPGRRAALDSTAAIAAAIGCEPEAVLPASTGVIGQVLPAERIRSRAGELVEALRPDGAGAFAEAIRTTDRFAKLAHAELPSGARVLGIAKGAGMIHPDMSAAPPEPHATMLAFLFTDAVVQRDVLQHALERACDASFNACSVDGDTSTNDTALVLASGKSGAGADEAALSRALEQVCTELARMMVRDGEGAEHCVDLVVSGASSRDAARQLARTIATSPLVKTALFGCDINWGRIVGAAGRAGVPFDPGRVALRVGEVEVVRDGLGCGDRAEQLANELMKAEHYCIELSVGDGPGRFRYITSDLGHGYVDVNAGYRS